jgi:hypothetical protein
MVLHLAERMAAHLVAQRVRSKAARLDAKKAGSSVSMTAVAKVSHSVAD